MAEGYTYRLIVIPASLPRGRVPAFPSRHVYQIGIWPDGADQRDPMQFVVDPADPVFDAAAGALAYAIKRNAGQTARVESGSE